MTRALGIVQDKGGVGKTVICRGLAEVVPGAPLLEIDSSQRMIELGKRVRFFPMRADREAIELTAANRPSYQSKTESAEVSSAPKTSIPPPAHLLSCTLGILQLARVLPDSIRNCESLRRPDS
jgi:hypothetical protein